MQAAAYPPGAEWMKGLLGAVVTVREAPLMEARVAGRSRGSRRREGWGAMVVDPGDCWVCVWSRVHREGAVGYTSYTGSGNTNIWKVFHLKCTFSALVWCMCLNFECAH